MAYYLIIVIPIGKSVAANTDANKVDSGKTSKTFTVGLSPTGNLPITHQWCCWWVSDKEAALLRKDFNPKDPANPTNKHQSKMFDLRTATPDRILTQLGLKPIEIPILGVTG